MRKITLLLLLTLANLAFSQVGVNTENPHPSAALHLESDNAGLLLPHVALKSIYDLETIPDPANGLIVFNVGESDESLSPDDFVYPNLIYVYDGEKWKVVMDDDTGLISLNLPRIYARGRKSTSGTSFLNQNNGTFDLDVYDSNMVKNTATNKYDGRVKINYTGYYKFSITINKNFNYSTSSNFGPVIGYNGDFSNILSYLFRPINGTGVQNYKVSYSGILYFEEGAVTGGFNWALGGSNRCSSVDSIGEQDVIWEYLGKSL